MIVGNKEIIDIVNIWFYGVLVDGLIFNCKVRDIGNLFWEVI